MPPSPSGRQVVLVHGEQRVVVVEVGGGLRTYDAAGVAVLDGYAESERCDGGRGQPLLPWPNRLEDGTYTFDGVEETAPLSEPARANAIHGLTRWAPWDVLDAGTDHATMGFTLRPQPGWAWILDLRIRYTLGDAGLEVTLTATNPGVTTCPFAAGFHPYFKAPTGSIDDLEVTVPAATRYLADDRGIPTGETPVDGTDADLRRPTRLDRRVLDVAMTGLQRDAQGMAVCELRDPGSGRSVQVRLDPAWTHVMVFTGDTVRRPRQGLAVEPMTAPANAFRTGLGLVRLDPGGSFEASWAIMPSWI